jgi:hypothetical protein
MNWLPARGPFEENFVSPELANTCQVFAVTVININNTPTPIKVTSLKTNVSTILSFSKSKSYGNMATRLH